jgi:hypothetical protein
LLTKKRPFCVLQASSQAPAALQGKLSSYVKDAEAFFLEGLGAEDAQQRQRQQTLGELLLGLPPPQPTPSHLSDAGLVLDHAVQAAAAGAALQPLQVADPALAAHGQQQQQEGSAGEPAGGQQQQQQEEQLAVMLQQSLLQADNTNRAELEAMLLR